MTKLFGPALASALFALAAFAGAQEARPPAREVEVLPDHIVRRILADEPEQALNQLSSEGRVARGVVAGTKRWSPSDPISVCFFGGARQLRSRIAAVAAQWERQGTPIRFDFGDRNDPDLCRASRPTDVRIGYSQPGYWSMIGQDSLVHVDQHEESMNFARFDRTPPDEEEFNRVVLHEFGHALGFQHEHQQARIGCEDQFNWPVVYSYLQGPPNNWSVETIDLNMRSRAYMAGDVRTPFNRQSIMLYTFPVEFYNERERSRCYSRGNHALSAGDAELLRLAYGAGARPRGADAATVVQAARQLAPEERGGLEERVRLFNADRATKNQILRVGNKKYTDVDIRACSTQPATLKLIEDVTQALNTEPRLGLLRYRGLTPASGLSSTVTILADADHPEVKDARRLLASLSQRFPGQVAMAENPGADRWLLTVAVCGRPGA